MDRSVWSHCNWLLSNCHIHRLSKYIISRTTRAIQTPTTSCMATALPDCTMSSLPQVTATAWWHTSWYRYRPWHPALLSSTISLPFLPSPNTPVTQSYLELYSLGLATIPAPTSKRSALCTFLAQRRVSEGTHIFTPSKVQLFCHIRNLTLYHQIENQCYQLTINKS